MSRKIICCLTLLATVALNGTSQGQDLNAYMAASMNQTDAMLANQYGQMNQLNLQMQQTENQIVSGNMNDPRVQQMYQQYIASGMPYGQMNLQQFAYYYAATDGFTQRGMNQYNGTTREIQANEGAAARRYHDHVNNLWAATNAERFEMRDRHARDVGDLMSGSTTYSNPHGSNVYLPYTAAAGQVYTDWYGRTWTMDAQGNYQYVDGNGYTHQYNPAWNR